MGIGVGSCTIRIVSTSIVSLLDVTGTVLTNFLLVKNMESIARVVTCIFVCSLIVNSDMASSRERMREFESARFYARGNTYIAAMDSNEATRGNPATLAEPKLTFQLRWAQADLFVGENTISTISDLTSLSAGDSAVSLLNTFRDKFGKRQYGRFQLSPLAFRIMSVEVAPVFGATAYVDARLPTTPEVEIYSDSVAGANISFAFAMSKQFFLGATLRPMHRTLFVGEMAFADVMDFVDDSDFSLDDIFQKREGFHLGLDVGGIYTSGKNMRLGFLVENLGYAGIIGDFKNATPEIEQRLGAGMMYRWALSKAWNWDFLADVHDLTSDGRYNMFRLVHLGTELGTSYFTRDSDLGVALGVNEGYFTMGAFLDAWLARLTFSYYAVELGEYPGQRKDRRYGISLESSMTF